MHGRPLTVCLFDPHLHEFAPHKPDGAETTLLASTLKIPLEKVRAGIESFVGSNPMLGQGGCCLGISYQPIYDMPVRAILEAACQVTKEGIPVKGSRKDDSSGWPG